MPRIFDNIDQSFLPALRETLVLSDRADYLMSSAGLVNSTIVEGSMSIDPQVPAWFGYCSLKPQREKT